MIVEGVGNLCLWCFEEMGDSHVCQHCGHDEREISTTEQVLMPGSVIGGHYLIGRVLGQGGFGITYLAYDLDLHIKIAIKEYFPSLIVQRVGASVHVSRSTNAGDFAKGVESFYREAQSIAKFGTHPNVVRVYSLFRENDTAYFVMDFVDGVSLQDYLEDHGGKISFAEARQLLEPIGNALMALHREHLLHRDVKPANIYVTKDGVSKLLDFGASRYETSEQTHSSAAVLTPGYAPAEQYGSITAQGCFTDVYALAATFYRSISGIVPPPALDRVLEDELIPLHQLDGNIPAQAGKAVSHAMAVKVQDRTQSIEDFLKELGQPGGGGGPKAPVRWYGILGAALAVFAAAALVLWKTGVISGPVSAPASETSSPAEQVETPAEQVEEMPPTEEVLADSWNPVSTEIQESANTVAPTNTAAPSTHEYSGAHKYNGAYKYSSTHKYSDAYSDKSSYSNTSRTGYLHQCG